MPRKRRTPSLMLLVGLALAACAPLAGPPSESTGTAGTTPLADYATLDGVADLPRQPLDQAIRPTDLHGTEYVGIGADNEVYLVDWASGQQTQLTDDGLVKANAVLSEDYVAWIAFTRMADQELPLAHVFVLDRHTVEQRTITAEPAPRMQLVLDGHRLAWADKRNELDGHYTAYDLYAHDLATQTEIAVAVAPGAQHQPSLSGDRLVWADNRDSPHRDDPLAGCGNCSDNRYDLYLYDFNTQTTQALVAGEGPRVSPAISGDRVAWIGYDPAPAVMPTGPAIGLGDVYLLDLATGQTRRVTQTPQSEEIPLLAGERLLWLVRHPCDVVTIQQDGTATPLYTGVYVLELESERVRQLTGYVEPVALLDAGAAVIVEGCQVGFEAYQVSLD